MSYKIRIHASAKPEQRDGYWAVRTPALPMIVYGDTEEAAMRRAHETLDVFLRAYLPHVGPDGVASYLTSRGVRCVIEDADSGRPTVSTIEALVHA